MQSSDLLLQASNAQLKRKPCRSEEDDEDEGDCEHHGLREDHVENENGNDADEE